MAAPPPWEAGLPLRLTLPMNRPAAREPENPAGTAAFAAEHGSLATSVSITAGWNVTATLQSIRINRKRQIVRVIHHLKIVAVCVCLAAIGPRTHADTMHLGAMPAGKILFLGNSITMCPQADTTAWWGLTASTPDKDYAHLLTQRINAATGGSLAIEPPNPRDGYDANNRWYPSYGLPNWKGNILNIADVFERNYDTWNNARIQSQLDLKADIVVLQFGENMTGGTLDQFKNALKSVLTGLKNSSNPNIFVTSYVMGEPGGVADIKRQLVAEDPTHRVYVDLSAVLSNPANVGGYAHPSDAGMAVIADTMFAAMATHAVPEPSSIALAFAGLGAMLWYASRKRKQ
jgi:hypothetical protein